MPNSLPFAWSALKAQARLGTSSHVSLALGIALLIGVLVASYMQASVGIDTMKLHESTAQRTEDIQQFETRLQEVQTIMRAYVTTRDAGYLKTLSESLGQIRDARTQIAADLAGTTEITAPELLPKADIAIADLTRIIEQIRAGNAITQERLDLNAALIRAHRIESNQVQSALLRLNVQRVQQSVDQFKLARIATVFLALAALTLLMIAIAQKQKKQALTEKIDALLRAENIKLEAQVQARTEELTQLATYLTTLQEREKHHLARELHDELGALLTAAKLDADWIERKLPPEIRASFTDRLNRLRQNLVSGITLKRRITNGLRPALLHDLGLVQALNALVEEFRQGGDIEVVLDLPEQAVDIAEDKALSLFRIVQEALTNIRKYSQARQARVRLYHDPHLTELCIEDDGIGFDPGSPKLARHGLAGMRHRVFTHGGQFDLAASPGAGVRILVTLPA